MEAALNFGEAIQCFYGGYNKSDQIFGHSIHYVARMSKNGASSQKLTLRIFVILVYELQGGKY